MWKQWQWTKDGFAHGYTSNKSVSLILIDKMLTANWCQTCLLKRSSILRNCRGTLCVTTNCAVCQSFISQVLYKHLLSIVANTIDCVCSKILNHGLNHGLLFSLFKTLKFRIKILIPILLNISVILDWNTG